ncbi:MAG: energy-coupling factor transporter transmembrane protein EcfT [Clostridia bacterium]|nr:energy-coupling factor transporter transmembrane protein EcfT [Clostridia bacterium]MBO7289509.1 energy-coupling factor transporter transmembrane protein EcfT [Clostridia bacterium]
MLTDITLGQYFPIDSVIHKIDPRAKILFTLFYIILVFLADSYVTYGLVALFSISVVVLSKIKFTVVLKSLKPMLFVIIITAVINVFFTSGTEILWSYKFIKITKTGVVNAVNMALRLIFLVVGSSLLTYTTSPIMLTDGIERLLKPFSKIGLPSHEIAMMMTIALRFIPTLLEETEKIMTAQKSRGADFESGNIIKRAKALIPVLIPLFINSFKRADELATAMECRCYRGGEGRTRLRVLKFGIIDLFSLIIMLVFSILMITFGVLNI